MKKKVMAIISLFFISFTAIYAESDLLSNGTIIESNEANGHKIIVRAHEQEVTIDYSAEESQMLIYDNPFSQKVIGNLEKKDTINIHEIYIIDSKEMWFKFTFRDITGFLLFDKEETREVYDFYQDSFWQPVETIKSGEQIWHTLKCEQSFLVYTNLNIRDKPGLQGKKIGMITANHSNYVLVKTMEITVETEKIDGETERWAKVNYNGLVGWVFGGYLAYERGGPRFHSPESRIELSLGQGV